MHEANKRRIFNAIRRGKIIFIVRWRFIKIWPIKKTVVADLKVIAIFVIFYDPKSWMILFYSLSII